MPTASMQRESAEFDVVVVGGGPAGLATAIRLKQLATEKQRELSVCVLEKGAEIGAHILSGAVMDPRALAELLPDWKARGAPLGTPVSEDRVLVLTAGGGLRIPNWMLPQSLRNEGNFVLGLGKLCRWLGKQAEESGVEIFPGFAASEILYGATDEKNPAGVVIGVATGDAGRLKDGSPGPNFAPGMELRARYTIFAEGCRGHLGKELEARFHLRAGANPQTYGLGIKELWEVKPENHQPGLVIHTGGWPMDAATYGGGFVYHLEDRQVAVGFVVGLGYRNPYLSPFEEMQRFKRHPRIQPFLDGGRRICYGARALAAGGLQSLPKLIFPGGALVGDDAGLLNAARIKGSHCAIKSGMLVADACFAALAAGRSGDELIAYPQAFRQSWLYDELHKARNFKPWMAKGFKLGSLMFSLDQHVLRGNAPWTLANHADHNTLQAAAECTPIDYPKPDGVISFDRLSSVFLSNTQHTENQPCHLRLRDPDAAIRVNLASFDAPEQRYCPAGVYEILRDADGSQPRLQINAANCVHCKTCDIKDPGQNIDWVAPQGGEGPNYPNM